MGTGEYGPLIDQITAYLKPFKWSKANVRNAVRAFEVTHGQHKLEAMSRFIGWGEKHEKGRSWIASALGHDLNGCHDKLMSPRTGGY